MLLISIVEQKNNLCQSLDEKSIEGILNLFLCTCRIVLFGMVGEFQNMNMLYYAS